MRKLLTVGAVAAIAIWGVAQIADDGHASFSFSDRDERREVGTRNWPVRGFDRISAYGADDVVVRVGPAESVMATGPADLLDRLSADVTDGKLRLGRARGVGIGFGPSRGRVVFTVTVPRLAGAAIAGSGDMSIDKVDGQSFKGAVAGSGSLAIAALRTERAEFAIAGSGETRVAGEAQALELSIAGSGDFAGEGLRANRAKIVVAGSGDARAAVDGEADVRVMGSGDVDILGKPVCRVKKAGSGDVRCPA